MSEGYETVSFELADGVATMTLNRPEGLNAWNPQLGVDLTAAFARCASDPEVRTVILTGAGRAFCSGADLRGGFSITPEGKPDLRTRLREVYNPVIRAVRALPKPVIAAVNGGAVGVGASLALACDHVIAAESGYLLLAFANIGLTIDGGASSLLAGRIGFTRAAEMALLGQRVPAATARDWGLINAVVPDAELMAAAGALGAGFAAGPPLSYAATKTLLNATCFAGLDAALDAEAELQQGCGESADFAEGVGAFLEKRPAHFTGR